MTRQLYAQAVLRLINATMTLRHYAFPASPVNACLLGAPRHHASIDCMQIINDPFSGRVSFLWLFNKFRYKEFKQKIKNALRQLPGGSNKSYGTALSFNSGLNKNYLNSVALEQEIINKLVRENEMLRKTTQELQSAAKKVDLSEMSNA